MQYKVTTPVEYLQQLDPDWRKEKLEEVRDLIVSLGPELKEGIEYNMLCYTYNGTSIFHLNAQKGYVSLYVGNIDKVDNSRTLLKALSMGKGCIRIKKSIHLPNTGIGEFIQKTIDLSRIGKDTDC